MRTMILIQTILLLAVLRAVEANDRGLLVKAAPDLKEQVRMWIEDNRRQGVTEHFRKVKIHQTEISRYQKAAGSGVEKQKQSLRWGIKPVNTAVPPWSRSIFVPGR